MKNIFISIIFFVQFYHLDQAHGSQNGSSLLIITHPTSAFDDAVPSQASGAVQNLTSKFLSDEKLVFSLVDPKLDWNNETCGKIKDYSCAWNYLTYLPEIKNTRILRSEGGEHRVQAFAGQKTVLAGGYFEACLAQTFANLIINSNVPVLNISYYVPAVYFSNSRPKNIQEFYNMFRRMVAAESEVTKLYRLEPEKISIFLKVQGRNLHIFGRGSKMVYVSATTNINQL